MGALSCSENWAHAAASEHRRELSDDPPQQGARAEQRALWTGAGIRLLGRLVRRLGRLFCFLALFGPGNVVETA